MNDEQLDLRAAFADLEPFGYGAEHETPVAVFGLELALPLLVSAALLFGWARHRLRARQASAAEASAAAPDLRPGPAVVRGVVDGDPGAAVVQVTIEPLGIEHKSKSSWHTTWTEVERDTLASPFVLRLPDGSRLPVRPGDAPRLVDDLSSWSEEGDRRTATAALVGGEEVIVRGELALASDPSAGYRGGEALVLGPPGAGPMELSTRGLARPERERAARFVPWVMALLAATVVAQLLALPYHVARALGETRLATVVERRTTPSPSSGKRARHHVTYRVEPTGELVEDEVGDDDVSRLPEGTVVPVRVSPLETTIGPHPTLEGGFVIPSTLAMIALCIGAPIACFRRRAWYERKLVETVDGRLGGA